jgi:predicted nucleic acid-binding protein
MTFPQIPAATSLFIDANSFIFHFTPDPVLGPLCKSLLDRIARQELNGITSAHILTNVAHRLMTIEAIARFTWPMAGIVTRLKQHHTEIPKLDQHRQALDEIAAIGIQVIPITQRLAATAAVLSKQLELLRGDALVVAVMRAHGITDIASHDSDFDRVPGITRYAPV